jgi:di/tricarboxylate transporter
VSDAAVSLVVLGVVVVAFVWNRLPVEIVAVGTALTLYGTGLLNIDQALSGFGDPVVIFIASLFVVSEALDSSGATAWVSQRLMSQVGDHPRRLLVLTILLSAVLTALITLNGSVAALLPIVVTMAFRSGQSPSQMAMPLAFAGSAGSLLLLTGSPVNVLVSDAAEDTGAGRFGFFEFALVGVPLLLGTMAIILLLGRRVLPHHTPKFGTPDLSKHAQALIRQYALAGDLFRLRVREHSPLVGSPREAVDLREYPGLTVVGVQGPDREPRGSDTTVNAGDILVVHGDADTVSRLVVDKVLAAGAGSPTTTGDGLVTQEVGVAEVIVPPRSPLIGETVFPGMRRRSGLVVLAVQRLGTDRGPRETTLAVGDTLLVQGTWEALDQNVESPEVLVVDSPDLLRRQAPGLSAQGKRALAVLTVMVVLLAVGAVPPVVAGLLAAVALILLRVVRIEQAYRAISWTTVILIGGLIPLSTAIQQSGAADDIAEVLIDLVGGGSPYLLLLAIFVLIGCLGQIVSNTATALIVIPIAISAAAGTGVSERPVLMLVALAASASFLTPIATPGNMMVMGPGGYHFGDYWKLGLPIMLWYLVVGVFLVPVIWPF